MSKVITLEQFIELLPNTGWQFDEDAIVRKKDHSICPWLYVKYTHSVEYQPAFAIFSAADKNKGYDRKLRNRMLKRCGLK